MYFITNFHQNISYCREFTTKYFNGCQPSSSGNEGFKTVLRSLVVSSQPTAAWRGWTLDCLGWGDNWSHHLIPGWRSLTAIDFLRQLSKLAVVPKKMMITCLFTQQMTIFVFYEIIFTLLIWQKQIEYIIHTVSIWMFCLHAVRVATLCNFGH